MDLLEEAVFCDRNVTTCLALLSSQETVTAFPAFCELRFNSETGRNTEGQNNATGRKR